MKKRIFVDAHVFDNEYQGTRTYIKEIYTKLIERDDLEFFFAAYDINKLKEVFILKSNVHFVKYTSKSKFYRLTVELPIILRKLEIDYAHFQYISPLIKTCKTIITIHDILFLDFPKEFSLFYRLSKGFLFFISSMRADILTTVSEYSKQRIEHYFRIPKEKIYVVPNGVNERYFNEYNKDIAEEYILKKYGIKNFILYVSRIEPRKNQVSLLNAFDNINKIDNSISLVFIGHTSISAKDFNDTLESLPKTWKDRVYLLDGISEEDLIVFYQASRLFCYPSKAEGFGIPPLEAAALRIPTYCSNTTAMSNFFFFKPTFFNPFDQEEISNILSKALENPLVGEQLNLISRTIQKEYSWTLAANKLYNLFTKVK